MPKKSEGRSGSASAEKKGKNPTPLSLPPAPKKLNPKDEIDAIFAAGKKRKKSDDGKETPSTAVKDGGMKDPGSDKSIATKKKKVKKEKVKRGGPRKKTSDGLTVYTEEELGVGKKDAGGTGLCPFDCDCCF